MTSRVEEMLAAARRERQAGNYDVAERSYAEAADVARSEAHPIELAHALRHVSDLARTRGSLKAAIAAASEAVGIYRAQAELYPLHLANALRLQALALGDEAAGRDARPLWIEARELYRSVGVSAGVEEAQRELDRASS